MSGMPEDILERLLLKAIEQNKSPEQFLDWVAAYKEALILLKREQDLPIKQNDRSDDRSIPPLGSHHKMSLTIFPGRMYFQQRQVPIPPLVEDLIRLLHAHAGTPMSLQDIEEGIPGISPASIYPTISRARDIMNSLGLPSDEIIRTIGRRGIGQKAQYLWSPDVSLQER